MVFYSLSAFSKYTVVHAILKQGLKMQTASTKSLINDCKQLYNISIPWAAH